MNSLSGCRNAKSLVALLALCTLPVVALAQPCALHVKAYPKVLLPGETAKVDVSARFPLGAYAFAASQFDVSASMPSWTLVSDGAVIGGDVLGIQSGQLHQPALGVLADPQQPYHAWNGRFRPATNEPALVSFKATPTDFWYYPSMYTSSSVPCEANAGEAWIFVNPIRSGLFAAAPGEGDSIRAVQGGFMAEDDDDRILMGLVLPAVQVPRESAVHIEFDKAPKSFSTRSEVSSESLSMNFTKITYTQINSGRAYEVAAEIPGLTEMRIVLYGKDGSVRAIRPSNGVFPVQFDRIPDTFVTKVAPLPHATRPQQIEQLSWSFLASDTSGTIIAELPDGTRAVCHGVTVLAWARVDGVSNSPNNLKQLALAAHHYESTGATQMIVKPKGY